MLHQTAATPTVQVIVVTYNHATYIEQAVNSVLTQETSFPFQVLVLDDCSTDGTQAILLALQSRHPDRLSLSLAAVNCNNNRTFAEAIEKSRASYVAWLDGDDFWCSTKKLQKQVELMEAHPECSMSFHNVMEVAEDRTTLLSFRFKETQKRVLGLDDLWDYNPIGGCSPMLRGGLIKAFPQWFSNVLWADWALCFLYVELGTLLYLPGVFGVYRVHANGLWSGMSEVRRVEENVRFLQTLREHFRGVQRPQVASSLSQQHFQKTLLCESQKIYLPALYSLGASLAELPRGGSVPLSVIATTFVRILMRRLGLWAGLRNLWFRVSSRES